MANRLSTLDASFLYLEGRSAPLHVGSVALFRKPRSGFDYGQVVALIEHYLPQVPRYRQRVLPVPGHLARPVWVDDPDFDLTYHVRRSALPRPGNEEQLLDLVGRLLSRPLDHARPLWEAYLVEGLAKSRIALVTKTHQALVDGVSTVDIGQLILDTAPHVPEALAGEDWRPRRLPGRTGLAVDAVRETVGRPREMIDSLRLAATDAVATVRKVTGAAAALIEAVGTVARPASAGPLNVPISSQRRFAVARAPLADLREVRAEHGGTVNDAVLAVVSGALRSWLLSRGEPVTSATTLRALVPLAVRDESGNKVTPYLVDLPVGEPNPVVRLQHISHAMRAHTASAVAASALLNMGGLSPPTLHALGARAAASFSKRIFNLVIANVPGPQVPLYAGTAQLTETFPVVPLVRNQALAVGVTSYDGGVYFGLTGDRDALSDVDVLAKMVEESVDELVTTTPRRS